MTGEPNQTEKSIHPCGSMLNRVERFVMLVALIVVLLDVFMWRPG